MQSAYAGTTTADFLKWERKTQFAFIGNSITMAGFVLAQTKPKMATCIDEWYFKTKKSQKEHNAKFLREMPKYAKFHPNAVLIGFIEQACGKISE